MCIRAMKNVPLGVNERLPVFIIFIVNIIVKLKEYIKIISENLPRMYHSSKGKIFTNYSERFTESYSFV